MEKQRIKIEIADRSYPLNIKPEDEEVIRLAAKKINERINYYKNKYPSQDYQDTLSMILLQFAISLIGLEQNNELNGLLNELKLLDKKLNEYIMTI
jgi:Cell division protein ZapA.